MGCVESNQKRVPVFIVTVFLTISMCSITPVTAQAEWTEDDWIGPYIDTIRYVVVDKNHSLAGELTSQPVYALIDDEIDLMSTQAYLVPDRTALFEASNVEMVKFQRSGVYMINLNCYRWPLNISGFRKALNLALDKTTIASLQGLWPRDAPLMAAHPDSIEDEMGHHYYDPEVAEGNALLDTLGFIDVDHDGWREGPGGIEIPPIEVKFYRLVGGGPLLEDAANLTVEAFHNLNISAYTTRTYSFEESQGIYSSYDFDAIIYANYINHIWLDSWARAWGQDYTDWMNATFHDAVDTICHSFDPNEISEALRTFQYLFVEEAADIPYMQAPLFTAYRTDRFGGFVEHAVAGTHSFFTGLKVYNLTSETHLGGTLRVGVLFDGMSLSSFTRPQTNDAGITSSDDTMEFMHDSLARIDPDLNVINWLAKDYTIENHDDDSNIPPGFTRYTVNIIDNATWSDGLPLTAADVSYSVNWFYDNSDTARYYLSNLKRCVAKTDTQLELLFDGESYWYWHDFCFIPIIPKHVPNQYPPELDGYISPEDFNNGLVTSGPFMSSEWVEGQYIELVQNPYYWKNPRNIVNDTDTTSTTDTTTPDFTLPLVAGVIGAAAVIVVGGVVIVKKT